MSVIGTRPDKRANLKPRDKGRIGRAELATDARNFFGPGKRAGCPRSQSVGPNGSAHQTPLTCAQASAAYIRGVLVPSGPLKNASI